MIATLPPKICPRCGAECWRMEVEDGLPKWATDTGPWSCSTCPWDERDELEMPEVEP